MSLYARREEIEEKLDKFLSDFIVDKNLKASLILDFLNEEEVLDLRNDTYKEWEAAMNAG